MRKISLATTYYNCPDLAKLFVEKHLPHVDELIIVDDGSTEQLSIDKILVPSKKLKLLRTPTDIGFNSHGCRNLAMTKASNDWVIMIDIDRQFKDPQYTFESIKYKNNLCKESRYLFIVHVNDWGTKVHSSVNDFLINKHHFFSVGGYDEEIAGQRWGDREFFEQLKSVGGKEKILHDVDLLHFRASTNSLNNPIIKSSSDIIDQSHVDLILQRIVSPQTTKPILQFSWFEIT